MWLPLEKCICSWKELRYNWKDVYVWILNDQWKDILRFHANCNHVFQYPGVLKEGFVENTGLQINLPNTCIGAEKWKEDGVSSGGSSLNQDIIDVKKHIMRELRVKFYLGKMRTSAWERVLQIALTNCYKEVGGKVSIYVILVKRAYMQSSTYFSRSFLLVSRSLSSHKEQWPPWRI